MRKPVFVLLVVAALLLTSCGPAMQPAGDSTTPSGEVFAFSLPRIVVDFDAQGTPSLEGVNLADIASLTGFDLRIMRLNSFYVSWMMAANVQHLELRQTGNGIIVLVNGKPLPYVAWSDASLLRAADFASAMGELFAQPGTSNPALNTDLLSKLLPLVRRLGLDFVLRFPHAATQAEIPLADPAQVLNIKPTPSTQAASLIMKFEVKYDQSGMPAVLGITPLQLRAQGINLGATNLSADAIRVLQRHNIQNVELRSKNDGIFLYVNGDPLPNIVWDDSILANVSAVYGQMNDQSAQQVPAITRLLPLVNQGDVAVLIHFPIAAGAAAVPAKMQ